MPYRSNTADAMACTKREEDEKCKRCGGDGECGQDPGQFGSRVILCPECGGTGLHQSRQPIGEIHAI